MRKQHILNKTFGSDRPTRIVFMDTESHLEDLKDGRVKHTLKLGHAKFMRARNNEKLRLQSELDFYYHETYWAWIEQLCTKKTKTYIVAHNCNYDIPIMKAFLYLANMGWQLTSFYSKGTTGIFQWRKVWYGTNGNNPPDTLTDKELNKLPKATIVWLDNGNIFSGKLEDLGLIVGYPKGKVDFDTVSLQELMHYCQRDVEILVQLWLKWFEFLDDNDLGSFRYTISSTAMNAFRYKFMQHIIVIHTDKKALELERKAYKGGRVECLYQGFANKSTYYYMDINSMYPYVLMSNQYPRELLNYAENVTIDTLARRIQEYSIIAEVELETTDNPFPYKHITRTIYPIGQYITTLSTPELKLALSQGWIRKVNKIAIYSQAYLFREYAEYFYNLRRKYQQSGNDPFQKMCKLFGNGLYGKWAQTETKKVQVGQCDYDETGIIYDRDWETQLNGEYVWLGGKVWYCYKDGESYNSFPAIASHTTAYARMYLFELMKKVPKGHLFYVDTDSLIVDERGYQALKHLVADQTIGALKIELSSDYVVINAPKDYEMENRVRVKGISSSAIEFDIGEYYQMNWSRINGMIRDGSLNDYYSYYLEKRLKRVVTSGYLNSEGWIAPFHLRFVHK